MYDNKKVKESMHDNRTVLDPNLTLFGQKYIDFEGYMCDIEKLGRDWFDKEGRTKKRYKAAQDTRVLHEDPVSG